MSANAKRDDFLALVDARSGDTLLETPHIATSNVLITKRKFHVINCYHFRFNLANENICSGRDVEKTGEILHDGDLPMRLKYDIINLSLEADCISIRVPCRHLCIEQSIRAFETRLWGGFLSNLAA